MSADNRTVATDALATLGTIIDEAAGRDAIHLAVEPVIASQRLNAGDHVGLLIDGRAARCNPSLGIVDPFLEEPVRPGQRFWLVVYPRQITSLRHVWTHPAFPENGGKPGEMSAPNVTIRDIKESEAWLREFIERSDCPEYDTVIAHAVSNDDDEYLLVYGDASGSIPDDFWGHVEVVTGKKMNHRAKYFSCSC